jgi:hypothetical protein
VKSAYPVSVPVLIERVREVAERDGALPSRNRIMSEFGVGAIKAKQALVALTANPDPTPPSAESEPAPIATEPEQASAVADPGPAEVRRVRSWPLVVLALPAFVAIWSGWVGLGGLTGFGTIHPLPGIADGVTLNTAITLPIGVETYAAYALNVWLGGHQLTVRARRFAKWSALGALAVGALGQVAFHMMTAAEMTSAPWPITTLVSCLPVVVLGCGAALRHLVHAEPHPA